MGWAFGTLPTPRPPPPKNSVASRGFWGLREPPHLSPFSGTPATHLVPSALCPDASGPDFQACLTSGHQPTLRDVANHRSASAVGRTEGPQGDSGRSSPDSRREKRLELRPQSLPGRVVQMQVRWSSDRSCPSKRPSAPRPQPGVCRTAAFPKHSMNFITSSAPKCEEDLDLFLP